MKQWDSSLASLVFFFQFAQSIPIDGADTKAGHDDRHAHKEKALETFVDKHTMNYNPIKKKSKEKKRKEENGEQDASSALQLSSIRFPNLQLVLLASGIRVLGSCHEQCALFAEIVVHQSARWEEENAKHEKFISDWNLWRESTVDDKERRQSATTPDGLWGAYTHH